MRIQNFMTMSTGYMPLASKLYHKFYIISLANVIQLAFFAPLLLVVGDDFFMTGASSSSNFLAFLIFLSILSTDILKVDRAAVVRISQMAKLVLLSLFVGTGAIELTPATWDEKTAGKSVLLPLMLLSL